MIREMLVFHNRKRDSNLTKRPQKHGLHYLKMCYPVNKKSHTTEWLVMGGG